MEGLVDTISHIHNEYNVLVYLHYIAADVFPFVFSFSGLPSAHVFSDNVLHGPYYSLPVNWFQHVFATNRGNLVN